MKSDIYRQNGELYVRNSWNLINTMPIFSKNQNNQSIKAQIKMATVVCIIDIKPKQTLEYNLDIHINNSSFVFKYVTETLHMLTLILANCDILCYYTYINVTLCVIKYK